jgi:N-methylhydantoinase A
MGLICSKGHREVIQFRRVAKDNMYDWHQDFPEVLIPRHLRKEIEERIDKNGVI